MKIDVFGCVALYGLVQSYQLPPHPQDRETTSDLKKMDSLPSFEKFPSLINTILKRFIIVKLQF